MTIVNFRSLVGVGAQRISLAIGKRQQIPGKTKVLLFLFVLSYIMSFLGILPKPSTWSWNHITPRWHLNLTTFTVQLTASALMPVPLLVNN